MLCLQVGCSMLSDHYVSKGGERQEAVQRASFREKWRCSCRIFLCVIESYFKCPLRLSSARLFNLHGVPVLPVWFVLFVLLALSVCKVRSHLLVKAEKEREGLVHDAPIEDDMADGNAMMMDMENDVPSTRTRRLAAVKASEEAASFQ